MRPPGPDPLTVVNINAEFSRQTADVRSGRNRVALTAGNFAQLHRHGEGRSGRLRRVGRQGLLFGFALGLDCCLKGQARGMLAGEVLDGSMFGLLCRLGRTTFEGKDDLANFDLLALLDENVFHHAGDGRRNLDDGFVGFEFHHRLTFGDFGAGRNHEANQIALIDVFAEFGEGEFGASGRVSRRGEREQGRGSLQRRGIRPWQVRGWSLQLASPASGAAAPAPFSTVKITWPTLTFCPSLTRISFTVPLTDEGTSTTALSVSSSMTGWPSVTVAPGEIIRRTRSPWSMFSPSSGSLNSVKTCSSSSAPRGWLTISRSHGLRRGLYSGTAMRLPDVPAIN